MKLIDEIAETLQKHFAEVFVHDQRGDGHFVQIVAVDTVFEGKSLVGRSRMMFAALGDMKQKVHAYSVKGFTPLEWETKKGKFELIEYQHLR